MTEANFNQQVTVPTGTLVKVVLANQGFGPWTLPQSSNLTVMPRLSASSRCVTPITATFRANGPAEIRAARDNGEMSEDYKVSIQVTQ